MAIRGAERLQWPKASEGLGGCRQWAREGRAWLFFCDLSCDSALAPFLSFLLLSFSPLWRQDSTAAFQDLVITLCSGNLPSEFLLLVSRNSSAGVARKRNRVGCPAIHLPGSDQAAGPEGGLTSTLCFLPVGEGLGKSPAQTRREKRTSQNALKPPWLGWAHLDQLHGLLAGGQAEWSSPWSIWGFWKLPAGKLGIFPEPCRWWNLPMVSFVE